MWPLKPLKKRIDIQIDGENRLLHLSSKVLSTYTSLPPTITHYVDSQPHLSLPNPLNIDLFQKFPYQTRSLLTFRQQTILFWNFVKQTRRTLLQLLDPLDPDDDLPSST